MEINMENTTMSDMIYLFLDGETNQVQQNVLFESLAKNPELQTEFQQALQIKSGFSADKEMVAPSAALTAAVFEKAGIAGGGEAVETGVADGSTAQHPVGIAGFISKFKSFLLTSSITALVTAGLFQFAINPIFNKELNAEKTLNKTQAVISHEINKNSFANNNVPVVKSHENVQQNPMVIYKVKYVPVEKAIEKSEEKQNIESAKDTKNEVTENATETKKINTIDMPSSLFNENKLNLKPKDMYLLNDKNFSINELKLSGDRSFELDVRGISGVVYLPYREMETSPKNYLNNVSLTFRKYLSDNHAIVLYGGREDFLMYDVSWLDGMPQFKKNPNIYWGGLGYRYQMDKINVLGTISPFSEIALGWSKYGFLSKGILGIYYSPESVLSFSFGVEGTVQTYKLQNKIFGTEKIGFIYMMGIRF